MVDIFVKQLDGCTYCSGGLNCTCASGAMAAYRASQGRVHMTACQVRQATGDRSGGTNLSQIDAVLQGHGIHGKIYRPISAALFTQMIASGRYGAIIQVLYAALAGSPFDCWSGRFTGNHAMYISGPGAKPGTWRVADPGADGRRAGIPRGFQDIPIALMLAGAARLDIGGHALGVGKVYAYLTPADPVAAGAPKPPSLAPSYRAVVSKPTSLWNIGRKRWVYGGANSIKPGTTLIVRTATYTFDGVPCYPVARESPHYAGYFVPKAHVKLGAKV